MRVVICQRSPRRIDESKIEKKLVFFFFFQSMSLELNLLEPATGHY